MNERSSPTTVRKAATTDVRKMDIRDRLQNAIKCGGLTGHLFELAVAEIDRLRMEIKSASQQEQDDA